MDNRDLFSKEDADAMELWCAMTARGENIPFSMPVRGISMRPLLKAGRDSITVIPPVRELCIGDIVVFQRGDGAYIVHRVRKLTEDNIETIGDNCLEPDAVFAYADLRGLVTHIQRNGRSICVDTVFWRGYGKLWMYLLPVRSFWRLRIRHPLGKIIRKILGK